MISQWWFVRPQDDTSFFWTLQTFIQKQTPLICFWTRKVNALVAADMSQKKNHLPVCMKRNGFSLLRRSSYPSFVLPFKWQNQVQERRQSHCSLWRFRFHRVKRLHYAATKKAERREARGRRSVLSTPLLSGHERNTNMTSHALERPQDATCIQCHTQN